MATLAAPIAHAQDVPAPSPSAGPVIVPPPRQQQQMPGVIPERFSIAPAATPTPAPVPTASPTPSAATPTPQRAVPVARATPAPRETAPIAVTPTPTPAASPSPVPLATPTPLASATPQPVATAAPVSAPEPGTAPWLWAVAGAGGTALLGLAGWLLLRRRRREEDEDEVFEPEPVLAAPPPPARVQPPPGLTPAPPQPAPAPVVATQSGEPFELALNPHRILYTEQEMLLEFELLIGNATGASAENIRIAFAAMSAHARQDEVIAGFHGGPPGEPGGAPIDLVAGAGVRMPVRVAIPRSGVQVVQVGGRPMFVPIVLVDLRWRGGLSVRRFGADFMLGTVGQSDKLGPFWLDRPAPAGPLAANRYFARQAAAA